MVNSSLVSAQSTNKNKRHLVIRMCSELSGKHGLIIYIGLQGLRWPYYIVKKVNKVVHIFLDTSFQKVFKIHGCVVDMNGGLIYCKNIHAFFNFPFFLGTPWWLTPKWCILMDTRCPLLIFYPLFLLLLGHTMGS